MGKYILQRVLLMFLAMFFIISLTFVLMKSIPGEAGTSDPNMDPEVKAAIIAHYGLDKPISEQYVLFMKNVVKGDFGISRVLFPQRKVLDVIMSMMPITMQLNLLSSVLVYPIGLSLGILMAIKKNTVVDHSLSIIIVFFISVPGFVVAALLQYFFAFKAGWFPILLSTDRPNAWYMSWDKFHSMILPILALSFGGIMGIARSMRGELSETLTSDFMLLAKTKGLNHRQATLRHALRNSFLPMTGMIVNAFFSLFFGSLYIETQFGIPGVGGLLRRAVTNLDIQLTIGWLVVVTAFNLVGVILTDILYGVVDPRVRMGGKKSAS